MSVLSRIMALFPVLHGMLLLASAAVLARRLDALGMVAFVFAAYLFAPLACRLLQCVRPVKIGLSNLSEKAYSPWWGVHQTQILYIALPGLEAFLRLFPGLYSVWLRLWGARVGKGVYWTPQLEVIDRTLVEIGDDVVFGHRVVLCSHVVTPRKKAAYLYVSPIKIEARSFIGAGARLGPGARIESESFVPYNQEIWIKSRKSPADA